MEYVPNMIHSFNSADIGEIAYATAFAPSVNPAPAPAPPLVLPNPIARYNFNKYTAFSSTIPDDVPGGSDATINMYLYNSFNTSDASNNYLSLYFDPNGQSGGVLTPLLANVTAVEIWLQYPVAEGWGQYFIDFRTGASNGYWITSTAGSDNIGTDFNDAKIWFNTVGQVASTSSGTPCIANTTASNGWQQIVVYPSASFSDDLAFFMRYTGEQGMPVYVADILIYNAPLNDDIVKGLYNLRCSRYGLSPIV
jgi:hypothetical protein